MTALRLHCIVPPYVFRHIAEYGDEEDRARALLSLALSAPPRRERAAIAVLAGALKLPRPARRRTVYDAGNGLELPGRRVRTEGSGESSDAAVNEAWEGAGKTYDYFYDVHGRRSIDGRGMRIESTVHYGVAYSNAHWNGRQMIYGDGDGKYFRRFTSSLEVIGHELAHGVTQSTAALGFRGQSGALAEHFSDVFGVLVRQYAKRQSAAKADWLVGTGLLTRRVRGVAIRSMKAPGTAYDDPILGRDPQPAHMRDYVKTREDDGGVHINSGIPNHAFYTTAILLGGRAWDVAGKIWYQALTHELGPRSRFQQCAEATWRAAGELFGRGSEPQDAVREAWSAVGLTAAEPRRSPALWVPPTGAAEVPVLV